MHVRSRRPGMSALRGAAASRGSDRPGVGDPAHPCDTSGCPLTYPSRDPRGHHPDTWTSPTISRKTPLNSTPPGEGVASRRGVVLPLDAVARARSRFRLPIGGELPKNRARTTALSALSKREGVAIMPTLKGSAYLKGLSLYLVLSHTHWRT